MKNKLLKRIRKKYWIGKNIDNEFVIINKSTEWYHISTVPISFYNKLDSLIGGDACSILSKMKGERLKARMAKKVRDEKFKLITNKIPHYK